MAEGSGSGGLHPQGEGLRRALRWLDDRVHEEPSADRAKLVGDAAIRFDLNPAEEEFLLMNWLRRP